MTDDFFNSIFGNRQEGSSRIHEEQERIVIKELDEASSFEKMETVIVDENGPRTVKTRTAHPLGCGHYAGLNNGKVELVGACEICKKTTLCWQCAKVSCSACNRMSCSSCIRVEDNGDFICKSCRRKKWAKSFGKAVHGLLNKDVL